MNDAPPPKKPVPPLVDGLTQPRRPISDAAKEMFRQLKADLAKPEAERDLGKMVDAFVMCADAIHRDVEQFLEEDERRQREAARARAERAAAAAAATGPVAGKVPLPLSEQVARLRAIRQRERAARVLRAMRERTTSTLH